MTLGATLAVQWAHAAFAILWVGGTVMLRFVVGPAIGALPPAQQRALMRSVGGRAEPFFAVAGAGTILLGILRGTVLGPLQSLDALGTAYGVTWLAALAITVALAVVGARLLGSAAERLYRDDALWTPDGRPSPAYPAAARRLDRLGTLELAGFAVVLGCMVLMSVGL